MDEDIEKVMFKAILIQTDERRFELSLGFAQIGGDVDRQYLRRAQRFLFKNWFKKNPALFNGHTNLAIVAYDAAETVYIGSSYFFGGPEEHNWLITEHDFSPNDWKIVNRISRRSGSTFEIRIKNIGQLYTRGP